MKEHWIGVVDDLTACDYAKTQQQIETVLNMPLNVRHEGDSITWESLSAPTDDVTGKAHLLLQGIAADRFQRIDQKIVMAYRPPYIICEEEDGVIVRLRLFVDDGKVGHECNLDLRAPKD